MRTKFSTLVVSTLALMSCALAGCGDSIEPTEAVARVNSTNLQRVTNLYLAFQTENNWVGPADESKFKSFIRSLPPDNLTRIGIDANKIDELFISERDGQPFKIRYSVVGNMMGSSEPVVFESVGVDGKRMVGLLNMEQREVDDAEYESLWAGKGAGPR